MVICSCLESHALHSSTARVHPQRKFPCVMPVQAEHEREIALVRAEGGAEAVQAAVGVATAAAQREVAALQRHCAELQSRLVRPLMCSFVHPPTLLTHNTAMVI